MYRSILFFFLCLFHLLGYGQSDQSAYDDPETFRPKIHFSPDQGWMSDPNGLVYYDGEYHLFYQHHFKGSAPGTYWGHAVSKDLLHWNQLPIALSPDSMGYIFSGSCVVDKTNTSGLGTLGNPAMLAFFTYHNPKGIPNETQAMAYSIDKGRTWTKYKGNPIIPNPGIKDFRDPQVSWSEQSKSWLMSLAAGDRIQFYESFNGLNWNYLSEFGEGRGNHVGPWECPNLFPMKVKGTKETKWVLLVSVVDLGQGPDRLATATQYFIGDFDGKVFTSEQTETRWLDYGKDCYAGNTFNDVPDDKRIFIAWMQSHQYGGQVQNRITKTWAGAATFPRELNVVKDGDGYALQSEPAKQLATLYGEEYKMVKMKIDGRVDVMKHVRFKKAPIEMNLNFSSDNLPDRYGVRLKNELNENITVYYDRKQAEIFVDRTNSTGINFNERYSSIQKARYDPLQKPMEWRLLIDVASLEFFTDEGKIVFTNTFYPTLPFDQVEVFSEGGSVVLNSGTIRQLELN